MRDFDGKEYRYKNTDFFKTKGLEVVANYLSFKPCRKGLSYDIILYAGGTGVFDRVSIKFPSDDDTWKIIDEKFELITPKLASEHHAWGEDFEWLVDREDSSESPQKAAMRFIESKKLPYQDSATEDTMIYFIEWSDVNSWSVFWRNSEYINFFSFDQG